MDQRPARYRPRNDGEVRVDRRVRLELVVWEHGPIEMGEELLIHHHTVDAFDARALQYSEGRSAA